MNKLSEYKSLLGQSQYRITELENQNELFAQQLQN